mmetsp:Transcript_45678/g.95861  ORF Transcript_45678/g.95861 Transcript_45678/m.95861 type:complete len:236 (+) Transcript_45678:61-768(+)
MSGLRNVVPKTEEDVEAQKQQSAPAIPAPARGGGHNPVFLIKVIFKKVFTLLIMSDEDDISKPGGVITLLKDIVLGIILGVFCISTLIFLDHRDVIHIQSAHHFRDAAFSLLNDPETMATVEESTGFKFMSMREYEAKMKEISSVTEKLEGHKKVLERREAEAEEKKKEADGIRGEYESLMASPLLKLDKFCEGCSWSGKTTCIGRVTFLQETYNTRPIAAKVNAMLHESCINKD